MTSLERLECFYPGDVFGCIIGEGGTRIKEIREKHSVKIFTEKNANKMGFRSIRLEGQWVACWSAVMEITKTVAEDERAPQEARRNLEFQLRVTRGVAGAIIGKGGCNLKEWREQHAPLEFQVDEDKEDGGRNGNDTLRLLKIRGEPSKIADAAVVVADAVEEALQRQGSRGEDPPRRRPGFDDDRGDNKRRRGDNQNAGGQPYVSPGTFPAPQQGFSGAPHMMGAPVAMNGAPHMLGQAPQQPAFATAARGATGAFQASCNLLVDNGTCGRLIGSQGSVIKTFRDVSGCSITTDRAGERQDGQREIQMSGTISQVALGMNLIMNKLMDGDERPSANGGR